MWPWQAASFRRLQAARTLSRKAGPRVLGVLLRAICLACNASAVLSVAIIRAGAQRPACPAVTLKVFPFFKDFVLQNFGGTFVTGHFLYPFSMSGL